MARAYRMTSARRAAIRKAQLASARKRRGRRRKNIAKGVGVGVVGVTLAAGIIHHRRRGSINVVETTVAPSTTVPSGAELDVFRVTIAQSRLRTKPKKGKSKLIYGKPGSPISNVGKKEVEVTRMMLGKAKLKRAARGKRAGGRVVAYSDGLVKIKRWRPARNEQRRNDYNPIARRGKYDEQLSRKNIPKHLTKAYRDQKMIEKRNAALMRDISDKMFKSGGNYNPFGFKLGGK